jgi:hypothetical protein
MVGWAVVLVGAVIAVSALVGSSPSRDQLGGEGIALVMAGLMIVLAGNYVHHRALQDDPDEESGIDGGGPGFG